jgi:hypothetical protein
MQRRQQLGLNMNCKDQILNTQLLLVEYYVTTERRHTVFDVIFCSDLLLQIPPALAIVFHLQKKLTAAAL